jgi:hypothetical protein
MSTAHRIAFIRVHLGSSVFNAFMVALQEGKALDADERK